MDKDYFINDDDGYNWVSLSKPLSSYTQEELAEHLISNKNEYGTTQKIRIDGKIGAVLTTDFCETPKDFLDKYQNILDRAGFMKGNNMKKEVKKEKKSSLTIKPKALSKVSFMDYTQEELAHLVMDDKINSNDKAEYGIYEHRNTIFDSTGCNTIEDFINKYQEEFKKRRIKSENPEKVSKKEEMRIIEIPLGMVNYTQEDLAHLVMDNKKEDEVVGIKVNNGVIFDSRNCTTVEDFINKNEEVATNLGIRHNIEEKLEEVGSIEDIKYSSKIDPVIPKVNINGPITKKEELVEEKIVEEPKVNYQDNLNKLLKSRDIKVAISLFNIPRGNYYNGTEASEESKLSIISEKNKEYARIFNEKDNLDFNNETQVSEWLNKLVPYINTHALNLNLGINTTTESADKYLLKVMEEKGYSTDETKAVSNEQKEIARKLNELNTYHFFVSEYNNLSLENKNLNSAKTNAMAEINYLESLVNDGTRGLNLIGLDLAQINNKARVEKQLLETQIDIIDKVLVEKGDDSFNSEVTTSEERKANDAYRLASITYGINEIEKAISYINILPADSKVKEKLATAAFGLFNNQDKADHERYPELNDRDKYLIKLDNLDNEKEIVEARLNYNEKRLIESITAINVKLADLHSKYQIEEKKEEKEVEKTTNEEDVNYNLEVDKQEGIIDKIKNKLTKDIEVTHVDPEYIDKLETMDKVFTDEERIDPSHDYLTTDNAKNLNLIDVVTEGPKEEVISKIEMDPVEEINETTNNIEAKEVEEITKYDLSLDDDYYDLSLPDQKDNIIDFVTIKSFRQISKDLYDRINQDKVKLVVKKAIDKLREAKKAACVYLGFAAVLTGTIVAGHNNNLTSDSENTNNTSIETTINQDTTQEKVEETKSENVVEAVTNKVNAEEEYTVSLDEASNEKIAEVLEGKSEVYKSFADAYTETNAVDSNEIYTQSWKTAEGGEYFTEQDGVMNRLSKDEAEDYYRNGQDLVQSVENDGTVIGYVNIENNESGKSM